MIFVFAFLLHVMTRNTAFTISNCTWLYRFWGIMRERCCPLGSQKSTPELFFRISPERFLSTSQRHSHLNREGSPATGFNLR